MSARYRFRLIQVCLLIEPLRKDYLNKAAEATFWSSRLAFSIVLTPIKILMHVVWLCFGKGDDSEEIKNKNIQTHVYCDCFNVFSSPSKWEF